MLVLTTEEMEVRIEDDDVMLPGFRFHPTDEELVGFYLRRKVYHKPISIQLIKQLDIYKFDPWDLPMVASGGEKEWYFYCPRDRKYRNSARPNRVTGAGFWKATGTDRPIYSSDGGSKCIGLKKSLVFYKGRAARGTKTDWMMHEFRLPSLSSNKFSDKNIPPNEAWAICRIFKKANSNAQRALSGSWISPLSDSTTISNTMNPFAISNTTTFWNDTQQSLTWPLNVVHANAGYTGAISNEPASTISINDASSLLLNMSSSVLGGDVRGLGSAGFNVLPEPCNGQDDEWGLMKDAWRSSLVWDSSQFSTTYSTSNCNS